MVWGNPKDKLEEEVIAINTQDKYAVPKNLKVSEWTVKEFPFIV